MIQAGPDLIALLNSADQLLMADLFTFTLRNGTILRYTSHDIDLAVNGNIFSSSVPIRRDTISIKAGIDVDELGLTVYPSPSDLVTGVAFVRAVNQGMFDGADFVLERAFFAPTWQTFVGKIIRFVGNVSDIEDFSRTEVPMIIKSRLELLNVKMPRQIYQAGCSHVLFDDGCTLGKGGWGISSAVQDGSTVTQINCGLSQAAGYFDLGTVTFSSGLNIGTSRTVKEAAPGVVYFSLPLPYTPETGDTFMVYPGCDKTQATCSSKFNNLTHFSGCPYIPAAETAY